MSTTTILQIFIYVNVFVVGVITVIAVQHAYAHFRPHKQMEERPVVSEKVQSVSDRQTIHVSTATKKRLLEATETNFEAALSHSVVALEHDLQETADGLNARLGKLGVEVVDNQMQRYHAYLEQLRVEAETSIGGVSTEIKKYEAELKTKLTEEIANEKQRLVSQIDTKLADAVGSFLVEALQHNVDLGAQSAYLHSLLEEHKADFIREVQDET